MNDQSKHPFFIENLLRWHASHHRPLPWKGERNPYLVWLSEIILQQTRVEHGLPYFEKFKLKYPTVQDLAAAPEDELMKLWEGLGYYSRARNLHAAAKFIAHDLGGIFPDNFESIRSLRGVGDYVASAIASFAFDLPHAVVDGNVYRVLARFFGVEEAIDATPGKKLFAELAQALLDKSQPGKYNQAIMDFGATHCKPAAPKCPTCPLRPECVAFQMGSIADFPVKSKKLERRTRFFNYLIFNQKGNVFLKKRTGKDIWQNLYDFPLLETEGLVEDKNEVLENPILQTWLNGAPVKLLTVSQPSRQELTHQKIVARFWEMEVGADFSAAGLPWLKISRQETENFAFPKIITLYFQQKVLPFDFL